MTFLEVGFMESIVRSTSSTWNFNASIEVFLSFHVSRLILETVLSLATASPVSKKCVDALIKVIRKLTSRRHNGRRDGSIRITYTEESKSQARLNNP